MAFDKLFCTVKSKSKKSSTHQAINSSGEAIKNSNNHKVDNQNTNIRYVMHEFMPREHDEISVLPGDAVLYEYSDSNDDGKWTHVLSLKTHKRGFVPSEILSTKPPCKKKLPRSALDGVHKPHLTSNQPSLNGDNVRLQHQQVRDNQPRFEMLHSLQGSSGKQSFQKFPDLRHKPAYYNLVPPNPPYERYDMECRPFHLENYGPFLVTNNFVAREENDLNVRPGDYVTVLNKDDVDWYWVRRDCDQAEGFVPSRFICDYDQVKSILNKGNSTVTMKSSNPVDCHTYINHRPDRESLATDQQSLLF